MNKISIPLENNYNLIVEQNSCSEFDKEIFVGIENDMGSYIQDLAIIRPTYKFENESVKFNSDSFELLIFTDETIDDYTHKFTVNLAKTEEY